MLLSMNALGSAQLKVTGSGISPTGEKIYANAENRINTLVQSINVENSGDVTLYPGDEDYNLILYSYSAGIDLQTFAIPDTLAPGESKTYEIHWDFDFAPLDSAYIAKAKYGSKQCVWDTFRIKVKLGSTTVFIGPWMDVYRYSAAAELVAEIGSNQISTIDFGYTSEAKTLKYYIQSVGVADATITSITVPEGFTVAPATPFVVPGLLTSDDSFKGIDITLDPAIKTGALSGDMVISVENAESIKCKLTGVAMSEENFFEDFESGANPIDWIVGANWVPHELPNSMNSESNKYSFEHNGIDVSYRSMLITPMLKIAEGEYIAFSAAKMSPYSSTACRLAVYWSPDRNSWQLLKTIDNQNTAGSEQFPSSSSSWGTFVLDNIPAGEGFIGFEGNYVQINDVYGGKLANPEYDLYITEFSAPRQCLVNDSIKTTVKITNMLADKAVKADEYTLQLFANDKLVATAESIDIAGGASDVTFDLAYTPHHAGVASLKAIIKVGQKTFQAANSTVVNAESYTNEITIGVEKNDDSYRSALIPVSLNYRNSMSQSIYPAEFLAQFGLKKGDRITGVSYEGFDSNNNKIVQGDISIYMREVEETGIASTNPLEVLEESRMAKREQLQYAYDGKGAYQYHEFFNLTFDNDTSYVYDGGNLFVAVKSENQNNYSNAYFRIDASQKGKSIYKRNDNHTSFETANWNVPREDGLPVMKLFVSKNETRAVGTVTDHNGNPVANALVSYTAGNILYTGTTDSTGKYDIPIFRAEHEYTVTADHENYPITTAPATVVFEDSVLTVQRDIQFGEFSADSVFDVTFHVSNVADQSMEGISFALHNDVFEHTYPEAETTLDSLGIATVKCFGGLHTATFSAPGMKAQTVTFGVNKAHERYFELEEDVQAPFNVKADLQHDAFTGVNNILLSWNSNDTLPTSAPSSCKPFKSAANPNETFVITFDGVAVDTTDQYTYTLHDVAYGDHVVGVKAKYITTETAPVEVPLSINADDFVKTTVTITTNNGVSPEGATLTAQGQTTGAYSVQADADGVATFNYLPKDSYRLTIAVEGFDIWQYNADINAATDITANLIETLVMPFNLAIDSEEQADGSFNATAKWNQIGHGDTIYVGRVKEYIVTLDSVALGATTETGFALDSLLAGDHTLGVAARYESGVSETATLQFKLENSIYTLTLYLNNDFYDQRELAVGTPIVLEVPTVPTGHIFRGWADVPERMPNHDLSIYGTYDLFDSINSISIADDTLVAIYDITGRKVYDNVKWSEVKERLDSGIYIINGCKYMFKK